MAQVLAGLIDDAIPLSEFLSVRSNGKCMIFLDFLDSCLRGASQVVFTNNALSGFLIVIALFIQNMFVGFGSIIGLVSSTCFAILFEKDKKSIRSGLYGFNGLLVGAALSTFCPGIIVYIPIVIVSFVSFLLQVAIGNAFGSFNLPVLTMPFNISTLIFLIGTLQYNWFHTSFAGSLAHHTSNNIDFLLWEITLAIPRGIGQVYLCHSWISGIIIWFSIMIGSRIAAVFAFVGSVVGIAMAYLLGAEYQEIIQGLWGYNPVLGAMAIGGYFFYLNWQTAIMAVLCASMTCLVFGMIKVIFSVWGIPSCTLGFCMGTFIFLFQRSSHRFFKPIPLELITTHEKNLRIVETVSSEIELRQVSVRNPTKEEIELNTKLTEISFKYESLKQELERTKSSQGQ